MPECASEYPLQTGGQTWDFLVLHGPWARVQSPGGAKKVYPSFWTHLEISVFKGTKMLFELQTLRQTALLAMLQSFSLAQMA